MRIDLFTSTFVVALGELGEVPDDSHAETENIPPAWPTALSALYSVAGQHPLSQRHNRLLPPSKTWKVDRRLVFLEENQNVVVWAVEDSDTSDDPLVWQGQPQDDGSLLWHSEELTLTEFIVGMWEWIASVSGEHDR